jgi:ADP-ribose pyrophosphatase YjhB (NUDIX family)
MTHLHNQAGITEEEFLDHYDLTAYDQPSVTVDIALMTVDDDDHTNLRKVSDKRLKILLIKRKEHPFINCWALPGGFIRMDETIETAAYRELKEETGAEGMYLEQLASYGAVDRDPRGRIISNAYMALIDKETIHLKAGSDASQAVWFDLSQKTSQEERVAVENGFDEYLYQEVAMCQGDISLSAKIKQTRRVRGRSISYEYRLIESNGIAFDHGIIVWDALKRLKSKVASTDLIFQMMPIGFTLTELQKTYETILDKKLLKANFRRKIAPMVVETDEVKKDGAYRPSKVFRFNPMWQVELD